MFEKLCICILELELGEYQSSHRKLSENSGLGPLGSPSDENRILFLVMWAVLKSNLNPPKLLGVSIVLSDHFRPVRGTVSPLLIYSFFFCFFFYHAVFFLQLLVISVFYLSLGASLILQLHLKQLECSTHHRWMLGLHYPSLALIPHRKLDIGFTLCYNANP